MPMGSLSLGFLNDGDNDTALDRLKSSDRYALPELDSFKDSIAEEDLEIDMPSSHQSKADAIERKASKTWRALRVASRTRMVAFDAIEDDDKIDAIFAPPGQLRASAADADSLPSDARPIIVSGPRGAGKSSLISRLISRNPNVFGEVLRHTTKLPESQGRYSFVDSQAFNLMLDGDRFLEFSEAEGYMYGTSKHAVESIRETGKVALMEMGGDVSGFPLIAGRANMANERARAYKGRKRGAYDARYVLIQPPNMEALESQLKESGVGEDEIQAVLSQAADEIEGAKLGGFDKIIVNHDLETACKGLEAFIYDKEEDDESPANGTDVAMANGGGRIGRAIH